MKFPLTPVRLGLLTAIVALQACNSSSDSDPAINAQAIDGYIVAADVACDDVAGNATGAAGRFTCPGGTDLMVITGGQDVGFDETAVTGGTPFTGTLMAPGSLAYATPLSTLAVAMSLDDDGNFAPAAFTAATETLATAFGATALDLNKNPAEVMQLVRLNAQVHQVITAFASNPDGYGETVAAFGKALKGNSSGKTFNLTTGVAAILTEINAQLTTTGSALTLSATDVDARATQVQASNAKIEASVEPGEVGRESKEQAEDNAVLTLVRDRATINLATEGASATTATLAGFENASRAGGSYATVLSTALTGLSYDQRIIKVNSSLRDKKASIGFRMKSTTSGDARSLTYLTKDARFTATRGSSGSLQVSIPEDAVLHVSSVSKSGRTTNTTIKLDNDHAFTNDDGRINVNNARVRGELAERGIDDVLNGNGNYEVTFVIGGVLVSTETGGVAKANGAHSLSAGNTSMAGNGIKGYVTVVDAN